MPGASLGYGVLRVWGIPHSPLIKASKDPYFRERPECETHTSRGPGLCFTATAQEWVAVSSGLREGTIRKVTVTSAYDPGTQ